MKWWLLVYSKPSGTLLRCEEFGVSRDAIYERFSAEKLHRGNPGIEVVVLGGDSLDATKRTHGRYFKTVQELLAEMAAQLAL